MPGSPNTWPVQTRAHMVTGGHESVATVEVRTQRLAQRAAQAWPTLYRESSWGQI